LLISDQWKWTPYAVIYFFLLWEFADIWNAGVNYSSQLCSVRLQGLLVCYVCSDQLDAIAQKKLVNFVHDLMTQYFDFVCRRVQLEVITIS